MSVAILLELTGLVFASLYSLTGHFGFFLKFAMAYHYVCVCLDVCPPISHEGRASTGLSCTSSA